MTRLAFIAVLAGAALAWPLAAAAQDLSKYPDWSGQWTKPPGVGNNWVSDKPGGRGQQAPLTAEYLAMFDEKAADRAAGGLGGDPTGLCLPHGMPRMMIAVYPLEFIITPGTVYILTDYTTHRRIFTDGRAWPADVLPSFNGYSIGNWLDTDGDGRYDLLEIETRGFKGPRTLEGSGLPLHRDGQTIVKERLKLDGADQDLMRNETTVTDNALTRPWTVSRSYRRERNPSWDFVDCAENNPHVVVGKETYMFSADGYLMPTKKGQASPDLRYFQTQR
ncbi:MAG: hypothetical protein QOC56_1692 [Alphaproteobacteria bacterium]|nr:hypothetical protein [Alphaproteobacteria bacterium]